MNLNTKKVVVSLVLLGVVLGGVWCYVDSAPQRKSDAEIEAMIDFAQRQALEITIIEQAVKLQNYKQQIAKNQKPPPVIAEPKGE